MKINEEENKDIKFILVQIPEIIDDSKFKTICDLQTLWHLQRR